jgi:hypothetical protein
VPPPHAPVVISEREPAIAARAAETQAVQVVDPDSVKTVVVRAVA